MLAKEAKENRIVNYLIFNKRRNKDINNFITKLKKAFTINRVANNRKHVVAISYLKK